MIFTILLALSGLILSTVAIYYSVLGLTAIFAAAFWPIVVMGTTLEISKLVAASWLKAEWSRIPILMKSYMLISVLVLMLITSMGIFGFLSKAHLDQGIPSGDIAASVLLIDEKIKTERDNIETARKALQQLDAAVDQTMVRSTNEQGAARSAQLRRTQAKERTTLQNEITSAQKKIAGLNEERAPIAKSLRAVEAEVGPIKYIAALIYGDNPDANLLEKAVTWIIITIIFVFDPLAILMILASQMSYQWWRNDRVKKVNPVQDIPTEPLEDQPTPQRTEPTIELEQPIVTEKNIDVPVVVNIPEPVVVEEPQASADPIVEDDVSIADEEVSDSEKEAMRKWKELSKANNIHNVKSLYKQGIISELPWLAYMEDDLKAKADNMDSESKKKLT
jgi:hypothetical protein